MEQMILNFDVIEVTGPTRQEATANLPFSIMKDATVAYNKWKNAQEGEITDGMKKAWWDALEDPGFGQMIHLKNLMLAFPFFERIPDQSIILDNGTKYDRLIATRGNDYLLVYNYTSRDMKIDLSKISGKKKNVWWYNTSNGQLKYIGEYKNEVITYTPEKADKNINDGVLIAIDTKKTYLTKDQKEILTDMYQAKERDLNE